MNENCCPYCGRNEFYIELDCTEYEDDLLAEYFVCECDEGCGRKFRMNVYYKKYRVEMTDENEEHTLYDSVTEGKE